jgi:hypothetical protein
MKAVQSWKMLSHIKMLLFGKQIYFKYRAS